MSRTAVSRQVIIQAAGLRTRFLERIQALDPAPTSMVYGELMNRAATYLLLLTVLFQPWLTALASCCPMAQAAVASELPATTPGCHGGTEAAVMETSAAEPDGMDGCAEHSACASCQSGACGQVTSAIARNLKPLSMADGAAFASAGETLTPAAGFDRSLLRPPSIS